MTLAEESLLIPVVQAVLDTTRYRGQGVICVGARTSSPTSQLYSVPTAVVSKLHAQQQVLPAGPLCAANQSRDESLSVQFEFYGDTRSPRRVLIYFGSTWRAFSCSLRTTWQCRSTEWGVISSAGSAA